MSERSTDAPVRTRFAPSPTGEPHLGNIRTAALNWLFARRHGGAFILRFEDTDVERHVEGAEAAIYEALDWLGLDRDEDPARGGAHGPYRQSERLDLYRAKASELLEAGLAYRCYCTDDEIDARRAAAIAANEPPGLDTRCRALTAADRDALEAEGRVPALRLRVDPGPVTYRDRLKGERFIDGIDLGDLALLRSDGRPTYNFAVVVDDIAMRVSHVIRGVGHLSNTPKQVLLYRAFDTPEPEFVHIPTVLAEGGGKLSKRAGAPGVLAYREQGFHPDAVLNYLSLFSWSSETGEEFLTREQLIEQIDLDRIGATNVELDLDKMKWLSGRHLQSEPVETFAARLGPFLRAAGVELDEGEALRAAEALQPRTQLLSETASAIAGLFASPRVEEGEAAEALAGDTSRDALLAAIDAWADGAWDRSKLKDALVERGAASGLKGRSLYRPVRAALTGEIHGPDLADVAYALGRERTLSRLEHALALAGGRQADG